MSFIQELKRRNVIRVGIAYALAAWVLLQGADFMLDLIGAPDWVIRTLMMLAGMGLPCALIFAWVYEMTPEGLKLEKDIDRSQSVTPQTGRKLDRVIIGALAIALVLMVLERLTLEPDSGPPEQEPVAAAPATLEPVVADPAEQSIAVLPFVDMSPQSDQAYFADGIAEEILNVLVKTHSLKVAGRTSSFQFRDRNEDLRLIGAELGVEHILEGSIRKADNRVRITAQLVKAEDGFHLWSETYDRELNDIFAIQDEIARAITAALAVELDLAGGETRLATEQTRNMEAYDHYLEARTLIAQRRDLERAASLLEEAVEHDPTFAEAWAAGAQAHALAAYYVPGDRAAWLVDAERMARRALDLNPGLAQAHSVMGDVHRDRSEWSLSRASYQRALELNPDDVEANEQFAQMLIRAGYLDEALGYAARAAQLDPLSWLNLAVHASVLYAAGRTGEAWSAIERSIELSDGKQGFPLRHAFRMAMSDGAIERARELHLQAEAVEPDPTGRVDRMHAALPSPGAVLAVLSEELQTEEIDWEGPNSAWEGIYWAVHFGGADVAAKLLRDGLERSQRQGIVATEWLWYPALEPLYGTDAFKDILRSLGLDRYWAEAGYPKMCRPQRESDFICSLGEL
jgi:TolB-like protein